MTSDDDKIRKIIRLKRHEKPREGYFEDFLDEFRERRGKEGSKSRLAEFFLGRSRAVPSRKTPGWLMVGGAAYAALVVAFVWWPGGSQVGSDENRQPILYQPDGSPTPGPVPDTNSPREPGIRPFLPE